MSDTLEPAMILPPAMLGIIGGGQLGRMFTVAAKEMGYRVMVLEPNPLAPAAAFADIHLCAAYDDPKALRQLASCDAVTIEFENVDVQALRSLAKLTYVAPAASCVAIMQDREQEKACITAAGLAVVPYQVIRTTADIVDSCRKFLPGILKTATLGYDGKGQIVVEDLEQLRQAFTALGETRCVLEKMLNLHAEISVIIARSAHGSYECFPVSENQHQDGILAYSVVPARLSKAVQSQARDMTIALAETLDYVGVLAVELFVVGEEHRLLVNEMAPRPHNSGHYTLNACCSDQFQQQVRMMCGLSPASTELLHPCCMANILGDVWPTKGYPKFNDILRQPDTHLHLYGKSTASAGRKMGHFTVLADRPTTALYMAQQLSAKLSRQRR